ncbi:MAG TPA: hypothetical protein VN788_03305 [Verrucomicrobiae bacterium]|nr:hypothetical protein [Verrucomicrobiae bacterium]
MGETLLLFAETCRMGLSAAGRKSDRVLDMEHFVVKNVGDNVVRHPWVV